MTRRHLVQLAARAAAMPAGIAFFSEWLRGSQAHSMNGSAPPDPDLLRSYQPNFFSKPDFEALRALTSILIPTDETPGALEAHCAEFIDFVLGSSDNEPQIQKRWHDAMRALNEAGFHAATPEGRIALMKDISRPERDRSAGHSAFAAYRLIKRETVFAFYTSRVGMIEALDYRGNSYNQTFPGCRHPEHHVV